MRISVDLGKCNGHARCAAIAPDVYELDDAGFCAADGKVVEGELEGAAEDGAAACPEMAITLS